MADRLTKLMQQRAKLEDQIKQEEAKQKLEDRKVQDRRKIITGAIILTYAMQNETLSLGITALIQQHVMDKDKNLFPDFFTDEDIQTAEAKVKAQRSTTAKAKQIMNEISNEAPPAEADEMQKV